MPQDVYIPFLVTGVFVFTFTQSSVMAGVRAISGNLGLVRALHFPRASLPISFCAPAAPAAAVLDDRAGRRSCSASGSYPDLSWLLVVPALALQFVFNTGLALIMARLGSKTPDLAQLMPFVLRTWMYASGVMFSHPTMLPRQDVPHWVADVLQCEPGRRLHGPDALRADRRATGSSNLPPHVWALALGWALLVGVGGFVYFWKAEETVRPWLSRTSPGDADASPPSSRTTSHIVYRVNGASDGQGQRHRRAQPHPAAASAARRRARGARRQGRHLHRLPGRGHRPDRLQRLRQVHPAAGHRRACCPPRAARSTPTASPRCSASTRR